MPRCVGGESEGQATGFYVREVEGRWQVLVPLLEGHLLSSYLSAVCVHPVGPLQRVSALEEGTCPLSKNTGSFL